jgi:uncharacterized membrane protein YkvA (DUF1232 family)
MKKKTPLTFERAVAKAIPYVEHKKRLLGLLDVAISKSERYQEALLGTWESLQIFFRMIRAWGLGRYCVASTSIVMIVGAVIYFLNPFDLIPDGVPVFGLIDDAAVIGSVAKANLTAISNFRKWEILFSGNPFPARTRRFSFFIRRD